MSQKIDQNETIDHHHAEPEQRAVAREQHDRRSRGRAPSTTAPSAGRSARQRLRPPPSRHRPRLASHDDPGPQEPGRVVDRDAERDRAGDRRRRIERVARSAAASRRPSAPAASVGISEIVPSRNDRKPIIMMSQMHSVVDAHAGQHRDRHRVERAVGEQRRADGVALGAGELSCARTPPASSRLSSSIVDDIVSMRTDDARRMR